MGPADVSAEQAEQEPPAAAEMPPEPPGGASGLGIDGAFSTDSRWCLGLAPAPSIADIAGEAETNTGAFEAGGPAGTLSQPSAQLAVMGAVSDVAPQLAVAEDFRGPAVVTLGNVETSD
jgi:hypothetical protein